MASASSRSAGGPSSLPPFLPLARGEAVVRPGVQQCPQGCSPAGRVRAVCPPRVVLVAHFSIPSAGVSPGEAARAAVELLRCWWDFLRPLNPADAGCLSRPPQLSCNRMCGCPGGYGFHPLLCLLLQLCLSPIIFCLVLESLHDKQQQDWISHPGAEIILCKRRKQIVGCQGFV